ncbi:MAG: ubiquitin-like domain-containing protein [Actinomycetota bacterium]
MRVRPSRVRRLRVRKAVGNLALASAVLAVAGGFLAIQKTVTLVVQGRPEAVRTMSASVGELLDAEGIVLSSGDLVVPPEATPLLDGMTVRVEHGFISGAASQAPVDVGVWVMEGVRGSSAMLAARITEDWFSAGAAAGQQAVSAAHVVVMGKGHDVVTNAETVGELLSAMGIEPDRDDRVLPSPSAPLKQNANVRFTSIEFRVKQLRLPVPFTTFTSYTDRLEPGRTETTRAGVNGVMLERYRVKIVNGKVAIRDLLERRVLQEATPAKRLMGRESPAGGTQVGEASWYSFAPGSGLTAAHPWLPFGTVVTVTNLATGSRVQVVINDRGPFGGRIIDLSDEAFARIAPLGQGVCQVRLTW